MAVKKKTAEEFQDQSPESQTPMEGMVAGGGETEQAAPKPGAYGKEEGTGPQLRSLSLLADRYRVVGWQQAALLRLMGWEDDKRVSDAEYSAALETLKSRRIGGGRR